METSNADFHSFRRFTFNVRRFEQRNRKTYNATFYYNRSLDIQNLTQKVSFLKQGGGLSDSTVGRREEFKLLPVLVNCAAGDVQMVLLGENI